MNSRCGGELNATAITDAGLKELTVFDSLQSLAIANTKVTGQGLKHLVGCKRLESLSLTGTTVTDADLKELAGIKGLRLLIIAETAISNAGLAHLHGVAKLEQLNLAGCSKVTAAGVAALKKALPQCRVFGGPPATPATQTGTPLSPRALVARLSNSGNTMGDWDALFTPTLQSASPRTGSGAAAR
jgi:hypothetical protein